MVVLKIEALRDFGSEFGDFGFDVYNAIKDCKWVLLKIEDLVDFASNWRFGCVGREGEGIYFAKRLRES